MASLRAKVLEDGQGAGLYETNLASFQTWAPHLHAKLTAIQSTHSSLTVDPDGSIDIALLGQRFYESDAAEHAQSQLATYFAGPRRQFMAEPNPARLEGTVGDFCERLVRHMREQGIVCDAKRSPPEGHFLLVFGVGLGLHVAPLVERSNARVIVLVEPNLEFLYHSLFVIDWREMFERAAAEDRKIIILVERESTAIASKVRAILRSNNPSLLDGTYVFTHYASSIMEQAKERVLRECFLVLRGLGYFEDEVKMLSNAVANLSRSEAKILSDYQPERREPVFIVGSGPSVERDLDAIAAHSDRAVLISVGTGLRVLLNRGIRPDFHVEIENGTGTAAILSEVASNFDLGGITLIASLTVRPEVIALFDRAIMFFRERVSSTIAFGGPFQTLRPAGPTVANTALVAAVRLGFRHIYLFGLDMGSKAGNRFYADGSIYSTGILPDLSRPHHSFPGNFGGEASGETLLNWARNVIESVLQTYGDSLTVYNCSDGVRIAGAVPKVARAISLPGETVNRWRLLRDITAHLSTFTVDMCDQLWDGGQKRADASALFDRLSTLVDEAIARPEPTDAWVHELYQVMRLDPKPGDVATSFLSGTLLLLIGCINWYDRRVPNPEQRQRLRTYALRETRDILRELQVRLCDVFDDVERRLEMV